MDDCGNKCKCTKKVRNVELTTYRYDPKCFAKLKCKSPETCGRDCTCFPQNQIDCKKCMSTISVCRNSDRSSTADKCNRKCECKKKSVNLEITSYTYDPKCLAKVARFKCKSPKTCGRNCICSPRKTFESKRL